MPSGNTGTLEIDGTAVSRLLNWSCEVAVEQKKRTHSDSAPWPRRDNTNRDVTGTFTVECGSAGAVPSAIASAIANNTQVTLELIPATGASPYTGPAKLGNLTDIGANVDTGDIENVTVAFAADGTWTIPSS